MSKWQHSLEGAVVVITGASSGAGRAAAFAFAEHGARLVLAARGAGSESIAEVSRPIDTNVFGNVWSQHGRPCPPLWTRARAC